jgi:hypothetical protein
VISALIDNMLHVSRREFHRAFVAHLSAAGNGDSGSTRLLLTYAAESGLKALVLEERRVDITSKLPLIHELGHDLRALLKELKARPNLMIRRTKTRQTVVQSVDCAALHQAFRYGIDIDDSAGVTADLKAVCDWILERMQ